AGLQPGFDPGRAREYQRWSESGHGFSFRPGAEGFEGFGFDFGQNRPHGRRRQAETGGGLGRLLSEVVGGGGAPPGRPPWRGAGGGAGGGPRGGGVTSSIRSRSTSWTPSAGRRRR